MAITAALVKELRERTGAGMMDCKKALVEADGDIELAIENMRKSGQAKAAKKAGRVASEGAVVIKSNAESNVAAIVEINSETDFVARDENFLSFVNQVGEIALSNATADVETLKAADYGDGNTVEQARENLVAKIGENIQVRRVALVESGEGKVGAYIHGGRIGVVVSYKGGNDDTGRDVAMHVAASNPQFVAPEDISEEVMAKEKEIFTAQALQEGKPAEIVEKMITGRMRKFANEISLTGQPFVKDPQSSVGKYLDGVKAEVIDFVRFEVGEGIEKQEEDFAAEVMAQVKGA